MSTENQIPVKVNQAVRIGDWVRKNQADIAIAAGFVLVAIISFGIGYLSAPGQTKNPIVIENSQNLSASAGSKVLVNVVEDDAGATAAGQASGNNNSVKSPTVAAGQGTIVASKNGKKYYWPWSPLAKRIKAENLVWFKSEAEAMATGRTKSADFDEQTPAGYISQ